MTIGQFFLYGAVFFFIGGAMTFVATFVSMAIIGKKNWRACVGTVSTLSNHDGVNRLFGHSATAAYLILFLALVGLRVADPLALLVGHWLVLWLMLSIFAGALATSSIVWSVTNPNRARSH